MPELKLSKLPDRSPVRVTVTLWPELNANLRMYAGLYRESYGQEESVTELIPFMLQAFLDGDRNFARALKDRDGDQTTAMPSRTAGRGSESSTS